MVYFHCPVCLFCKPVKYGISQYTGKERPVPAFDRAIDRLDEIYIVEFRSLGGKVEGTGKGYRGSAKGKMEIVGGLTLKELPEEIKEQLRRKCKKILEIIGE